MSDLQSSASVRSETPARGSILTKAVEQLEKQLVRLSPHLDRVMAARILVSGFLPPEQQSGARSTSVRFVRDAMRTTLGSAAYQKQPFFSAIEALKNEGILIRHDNISDLQLSEKGVAFLKQPEVSEIIAEVNFQLRPTEAVVLKKPERGDGDPAIGPLALTIGECISNIESVVAIAGSCTPSDPRVAFNLEALQSWITGLKESIQRVLDHGAAAPAGTVSRANEDYLRSSLQFFTEAEALLVRKGESSLDLVRSLRFDSDDRILPLLKALATVARSAAAEKVENEADAAYARIDTELLTRGQRADSIIEKHKRCLFHAATEYRELVREQGRVVNALTIAELDQIGFYNKLDPDSLKILVDKIHGELSQEFPTLVLGYRIDPATNELSFVSKNITEQEGRLMSAPLSRILEREYQTVVARSVSLLVRPRQLLNDSINETYALLIGGELDLVVGEQLRGQIKSCAEGILRDVGLTKAARQKLKASPAAQLGEISNSVMKKLLQSERGHPSRLMEYARQFDAIGKGLLACRREILS